MNRKTIIACISVLAVLLTGVVIAVAILYSDKEDTPDPSEIRSDSRLSLITAVPSDAVMVVTFPDLKTAGAIFSDSTRTVLYFMGSREESPFNEFMQHGLSRSGSVRAANTVLSLHYNGELVPLLAIDACRADSTIPDDVSDLMAYAEETGLSAGYVDCSDIVEKDGHLSRRSVLLVSPSDVLVKSAERHLAKGISVADSDGFSECTAALAGNDIMILLSNENVGKLFTSIADRSLYGYSDFFKRMAKWTAFSLEEASEERIQLGGYASWDAGNADFFEVFDNILPAKSSVYSILPSYTLFMASIPMRDCKSYISAYDTYLDGTGTLGKIQPLRAGLGKTAGISPEAWAEILDIKEVATASFIVDDRIESVVLVKPGKEDAATIFRGTDIGDLKSYKPDVHTYAYPGFASSLFGTVFSAADEGCFTYIGGWIVSGSDAAVREYTEGRALENTLDRYMSDSGLQDRIPGRELFFASYLSFTEDVYLCDRIFKPHYAGSVKESFDGISYEPLGITVFKDKEEIRYSASLERVTVKKSKAPVAERDTVVNIPSGPFKVKNSATGKTNYFYQQDNGYLCLKDDTGKGMWAVPFKSGICGAAGNVDYFANGKLQILFASGSSLYLIDRLGRFVNPFPVELGKEISVGPGIYDFNGKRKYNVMVLHKDNTIDMYNLQGKKPAGWKPITAAETIKGLPEAVKTGGRTYWVVRTSLQTLIFGFYGGEPLTKYDGDRMIRRDSPVTPASGGAVTVVCYDGKERTIKLQ